MATQEVDEDQGGVLAQLVNRSEADGIGSRMGSGCLKEMAYLRRCTGRGFGGQAQMSEDFDNHCGIFNGGDECDRAPTVGTGCHVNLEHAFEQLSPAQAGSR